MAEFSGPSAAGLAPALEAAGLNLVGCLEAADYDDRVPAAWRTRALLPGARSVIVLGSGGRAFGRAFLESPEAGSVPDPVDAFTSRVVECAAGVLSVGRAAARAFFYHQKRSGQFADFCALAEAAGMGVPSRLGLLLHPRFGPWFAIRALLITERSLDPTPPLIDFDPCGECPAPCAAACPGEAVAPTGFRADRCARAISALGACESRCAARRACPVGSEHAYDPEIEAMHTRAVRDFRGPAQPRT